MKLWELPKPARKFLHKLGWVILSSIIAGLIGSVFNYFNKKSVLCANQSGKIDHDRVDASACRMRKQKDLAIILLLKSSGDGHRQHTFSTAKKVVIFRPSNYTWAGNIFAAPI